MATYQVFVNKGTLSDKEKESVAQAITDTHCEISSTPKYCIQVIFHEVTDNNRFICGRRLSTIMWINAEIRPHSPELAEDFMNKLTERVSKVCNFYKENIWVDLNETAPTNFFRYEKVFCEAGGEEAWYNELPQEAKETIARMLEDI